MPSADRGSVSLKKEYSARQLTDDEIKQRHDRIGYDPLDRALQNERRVGGASTVFFARPFSRERSSAARETL